MDTTVRPNTTSAVNSSNASTAAPTKPGLVSEAERALRPLAEENEVFNVTEEIARDPSYLAWARRLMSASSPVKTIAIVVGVAVAAGLLIRRM